MKKINILCSLALIVISLTSCASNLIEDKIEEILNEFRHRMCYELHRFNIRALDPFEVQQFNTENSGLKIEMKDLSVNGLSDFVIKDIKVKLVVLKFLFDIVVPKIVLKTKYSVNGKVGILNLNGAGDLEVEVINPAVFFEIKYQWSITEQKSSFKVSQLKSSIEKIKFNVTGLFPNEETNKSVNQIITDIGLDLVSEYYKQHEAKIIFVVESLLSEQVPHLSPQDLLDILQGKAPVFNENDPKPDCKNKEILFNIIPKVNL